MELALDLDDAGLERHADLRRREADAGRLAHRVGQVVEQLVERLAEAVDGLAAQAQARVAEGQDGSDGHGREYRTGLPPPAPPSEQALGVDVDAPGSPGVAAEHGRRVATPQHDVEPPATAAAGDVRRHRTEDRDARPGRRDPVTELGGERSRRRERRVAVGIRDRQLDEPPERRRAEAVPALELRRDERPRVSARDRPDDRMVRQVRLDDRSARAGRPRPARPTAWTSSCQVRSAARSSGRLSAMSAETTPTSATSGTSRPLVTRLVPDEHVDRARR